MSYDFYSTQYSNGWKQRCAKEEAQRESFWRNEVRRQRKMAEKGADDASSIVSSYASGTSTINTMILKDKIKSLEGRLNEERSRRELLEQQLTGGSGN
mmetsp:Transcript_20597/g.57163  ORF Transcript_20597/g.57163 Transcript_20597/m.57163 type:complete len:98 (-) Transcript_20597:152-445(-)